MTFSQAFEDHRWNGTRVTESCDQAKSISLSDIECVCCGTRMVDLRGSGNLGCDVLAAAEVTES